MVSDPLSSVQDGILSMSLGKAIVLCTSPRLRIFPDIAFEIHFEGVITSCSLV